MGAHTRSRSVWPHTVSGVGYDGPGRSSAVRYCRKDCAEFSARHGMPMWYDTDGKLRMHTSARAHAAINAPV